MTRTNRARTTTAVTGEGALQRKLLPILLVLLSLLAVYGDVIFAGKGFYLEDLTLYHHPMKKVVRDAVHSGEFPWWNPLLGAGQPLAANPAYELFYPGQWPVLVGDYDVMFQAHIVIHAFLAALGMFLLARSLGLGGLAAALGAVAYGAGGPMLSTTKLLPFMFAMTWAPYIALFVRRFLASGRRRDLAGAALSGGLQLVIGEPVTVLQTWLIIGVYAVWKVTREPLVKARAGSAVVKLAVVVALAAMLAAVQLLPAVDHARDSVRSRGLSWAVASNWSTPLQRPLEILFPGLFRQIHAADGTSLMKAMYGHDVPYIADFYVGLVPVLLALAYLLTERTGRRWIIGGLAALYVLAAGSYLPFFRFAYESGVLRSIRYPEKFMLGIFFVICILAAAGAQRLADGDRRMRTAGLALAGLWLAVAVMGALAGSGVEPAVADSKRRAGAVVRASSDYWLLLIPRGALAALVFWGAARGRRRFAPLAVAAAVVLSAAELRLAAGEVAPVVDRAYFATPALLTGLQNARGRLYHRAEISWWHDADPRAVAIFEDERHVWRAFRSGAFPLIPTASGVPIVLGDDLDETHLLPTAEFRDVWSELRRSRPAVEPVLWRMAGVEWIAMLDPAVPVERVAQGVAPVTLRRTGDGDRYWFASSVTAVSSLSEFSSRIADGRATATSASTAELSFDAAPGIVETVVEGSSRIELSVSAEGKAFLVLSVTPHKYWKATVDGEPAELVRANVGFQGLVIPAGRHTVSLTYSNPLIVAGAALSGLTLAALALLAAVPVRKVAAE